MTKPARLLAILLPSLLAATSALADMDKQVVWKLIDKKGKITYADKAPLKDFEGTVTRIEVDLNANRATLTTVGASSPPVLLPLSDPQLKRVKSDAELARALENLETAKKARKEGEEPLEDELKWLGKKGGGARPERTDAYHARIKSLDDAVKNAEAVYESARKAARQAAID
ncbi:MAG: hypothetical protein IPP91_14965 [Betaproteobacteria bacterium]|nr:hypothetical protein [Betaproteobacteria bacterium]